jgi:hypothetical protein
MSVRPRLTVIPDRTTMPFVAEELRELRQLAKDRRAASLISRRNGAKPRALPQADLLPRRPKPVAA